MYRNREHHLGRIRGNARKARRLQLGGGMRIERLEQRVMFHVAYGDFNGDGFEDLAIGIPGEGVPSVHDNSPEVIRAGAIQVIYGAPLSDPTVDDLLIRQLDGDNLNDEHVIADFAEEDDRFGTALAVGDFNGDGLDDLAIGVPGEDIQGVINAGAVNVVYGSDSGLTLKGNLILTQDTFGMAEWAEDNDRFGSVLSSGDYNGDGVDDLAIGVPNENLRRSVDDINAINNAGLVHVVYGQQDVGLAVDGNKTFDQGLLMGTSELNQFDNFGAALASADFNGDGADDLAIGVPGQDVEVAVFKYHEAGAVNLVWGSIGMGLTVDQNRYYDKSQSGVVGSVQSFANFGATLSAGNFDDDDYFDLAIGVVNEDRFTQENAGAVNVLYGLYGRQGFDLPRSQHWDLGMAQIEGDAAAEDHFGGALATGDFNGDGRDDLAIGVPGKDYASSRPITVGNAGGVHILFASSNGTGITSTNQKRFAQYMTELEDDAEVNDYFGAQLAAGDMTGDGVADLAIGVSGEDLHGAVHTIPGLQDSYAFQAAWDKLWSQDSIGVSDQGETDDLFGGQLSAWIGPQYVNAAIIPEDAFFLHSKPGAPFTLFLDFSGGYSPNHTSNTSGDAHYTPAFDIDGNDTYFSRTELDVIEHAWAQVAEDFAPFDINVTTDQSAFIPGEHFRVLIGGDGSERGVDPEDGQTGWAGNAPYGGNVFLHDDRPSDVFVFAVKYGPGGNLAERIGSTASHEAGHGLGLEHKNEVDANGQHLDTDGVDGIDIGDGCSGGDAYAKGTSLWSPIMGNGRGDRTIWTEDGEFISPGRFINVLLDCDPDGQSNGTIEQLTNVLELSSDDHGNGPPKESHLGVLSTHVTTLLTTGVIGTLGDVDRFIFEVVDDGWVNIDLTTADVSPNLDARLQFFDASGAYGAIPDSNLNEAIDRYLKAGTYAIEVRSQAALQGDLGQYSLRISRPDSHLVIRGTSGDDFGAEGNDALIVDDFHGLAGRDYLIDRVSDSEVVAAGVVIPQDAGWIRFEDDVEGVRLRASNYSDHINVEALAARTKLELFGNGASDTFMIGELSQSVERVAGDVVIHGGRGTIHDWITIEEFDTWLPEDNDLVHVYDGSNPVAGNYEIDATGLYDDYEFRGSIARSQLGTDHDGKPTMVDVFNVAYDEIEHTTLFADRGNNQIDVKAAPRFNRHTIYANHGKDTIEVESTPVDAPMHVSGDDGPDSVIVGWDEQNLSLIRSGLQVNGGSDGESDSLRFIERSSSQVAYTLTESEFALAAPELIGDSTTTIGYEAIETLSIDLGDLHNSMDVVATSPGTHVSIHGNLGSDLVRVLTASSPIHFYGGGGASLDWIHWEGTDGPDVFTVTENTIYHGSGSLYTHGDVEERRVGGSTGIDLLRIQSVAKVDELFLVQPDAILPFNGVVEVDGWQPIRYHLQDISVEGNSGDVDRLRLEGPAVEENHFDVNLASDGTHTSPLVVLSTADGELVRVRSVTGLTSGAAFIEPAIEIVASAQYGEFHVSAPAGAPVGAPTAITVVGDGLLAELHVTTTAGASVSHQLPDDAIPGQVSVDYPASSYVITYINVGAVVLTQFFSGDVNMDGSVDASDAGLMFGNWGGSGMGDLNGDGTVDAADAGELFSNWTGDLAIEHRMVDSTGTSPSNHRTRLPRTDVDLLMAEEENWNELTWMVPACRSRLCR